MSMETTETKLKAWCNGYEVIAAHSEDEAREVLRAMDIYEPDDLDGDGWNVLRSDMRVRDEDGKPTGETVGDFVARAGKPEHLWSCEP